MTSFVSVVVFIVVFFFKQKTAYEMRISDWSSDVCSSDLGVIYIVRDPRDVVISAADHYGLTVDQAIEMMADKKARGRGTPGTTVHEQIGRASCRERVCQYV